MYNIDPILWGKHGWAFLHYISLAYPDNPDIETQQKYKNFFINVIGNFLPCESCRLNYKRHLSEVPLTDDILASRDKFIYWLVDLHNIVNEETGKRKISYDEFNDIYVKQQKTEKKESKKSLYVIILIVIILVFLFITYRKIGNKNNNS